VVYRSDHKSITGIKLEKILSNPESRFVPNQNLGVENRKAALKDADFVVNAVQIGGYKPATVIDFAIPSKYGLKQTIADTIGIGGIMRALRTIPVMQEFADDMQEVCPDTLFLNYSNPMAILTGYIQLQLAALNMTNINPQLMTIQAVVTRRKEDIYRAVMLDPHSGAELSLDDIIKMCDEMMAAHGSYMKMYI